MDADSELQWVRAMLEKLLEQADNCAAETGNEPTAREALEWAVSEVDRRITGPRPA